MCIDVFCNPLSANVLGRSASAKSVSMHPHRKLMNHGLLVAHVCLRLPSPPCENGQEKGEQKMTNFLEAIIVHACAMRRLHSSRTMECSTVQCCAMRNAVHCMILCATVLSSSSSVAALVVRNTIVVQHDSTRVSTTNRAIHLYHTIKQLA